MRTFLALYLPDSAEFRESDSRHHGNDSPRKYALVLRAVVATAAQNEN